MEEDDNHALLQTLNSFWNYREYALDEFWRPRMRRWRGLSEHQKRMIPWYERYLQQVHDAILANSQFYHSLVAHSVDAWEVDKAPDEWPIPTIADMQKTVLIFTQLVREWSVECNDERSVLLSRMAAFMDEAYPRERDQVSILVPGAGLGRVVVDLVRMGFRTEGNELSYHMLLVSRYLLNGSISCFQHQLYPFVHSFSNQTSRQSQLRAVQVPDMTIYMEVGNDCLMSMSAGSFVDLYGPNLNIRQSGYYSNDPRMRNIRAEAASSKHVVVTNFFIDTGMNVLDYMETIQHVLKPGGHWVNFGPLLYHFETDHHCEETANFDPLTGVVSDVREEPVKGLELSQEDILSTATSVFGFKLLRHEKNIKCGYGSNNAEMTMLKYTCNFWVLQKCTTVGQ
ncbi:ACL085Cp [Eremothecium gossypii ATCC 10895]|uniref:carnosine N-methyltransferase n=1 Tax=Eremothecium gossypii (strain ATCC 10895 / CBS 109.51 / FGSC 9923 / NRRL Y-1056) TaxID=284811 RepID=Q75CK4_EREGS|nr:ACL085Cp [Eremothecium gossypii ATCC 10895]AAS51143.1 ACL085Cp [Eremothecium gossypii ATCC 10895]